MPNHRQIGPLGRKHDRFVTIIDLAPVEDAVPARWCGVGRRPKDRTAIARTFIATAVRNLPTNRDLLDRLRSDKVLRRLRGWHRPSEIPSEATFSRAFAESAADGLAERMREALVRTACADAFVGHISRDSTAIVGRERPKAKPKEDE